MHLIGVFVCALFTRSAADVVDAIRGRGMDLGGGLRVQVDAVPAEANASVFERNALTFDYEGLAVQLGKAEHQDAVKVGLFYGEGRGRKNKFSQLMLPAMLGFKSTTLVVLALGAIALLVLKALIVAKLAALISTVIFASKLFGKSEQHKKSSSVELDYHPSEMHPVYAEYPGDASDLGYASTASGNYYTYSIPQDSSDFVPSGAATSAQFSYSEPANNSSAAHQQQSQRRRDATATTKSHPQPIQTYITVRRKSVSQK